MLQNLMLESLGTFARHPHSAMLLVFVVMKSFPEAYPNIEQPQTTAKTTEETCRNKSAQPGEPKQKIIVGPLVRPGQDHEQNSGDRADQYEKEDGAAMQPQLEPTGLCRDLGGGWRIEQRGACFGARRYRLNGRSRTVLNRRLRINAQRGLRCSWSLVRRRSRDP